MWRETNLAHIMDIFYIVKTCGIPERGQQQLLKGNAHPGKVAVQKMWRVATYGSQGRMMTLKLRSSCDNCPRKPECFRLSFVLQCIFITIIGRVLKILCYQNEI